MSEAKRVTECSQSLFTCSKCCEPSSLKFCIQEVTGAARIDRKQSDVRSKTIANVEVQRRDHGKTVTAVTAAENRNCARNVKNFSVGFIKRTVSVSNMIIHTEKRTASG